MLPSQQVLTELSNDWQQQENCTENAQDQLQKLHEKTVVSHNGLQTQKVSATRLLASLVALLLMLLSQHTSSCSPCWLA